MHQHTITQYLHMLGELIIVFVTMLGQGVATGTKFNPNTLFCWLMVWEIALQCESGDL